jgi:hypothetical protein
MNQTMQNKVLAGQRKVQALWSEPLVLGNPGGNPVPSINALMGRETLSQIMVDGKGLEEVILLNASVVLSDLQKAPFKGQAATARGRSWRVWQVGVTQTTYELTLESPNK